MFEMRHYQIEALNAIQSAVNHGQKNILITLPTAAGKTIIFVRAPEHVGISGTVLILAHRDSLISQAKNKWQDAHPQDRIGIEMASQRLDGDVYQCIVSSVQTLRGDRLARFVENYSESLSFVICDECHHAAAQSYLDIFTALGCLPVDPTTGLRPDTTRGPILLGCTATPKRLDRKPLESIFPFYAYDYPLLEGMKEKYLCPVKAYRVETKVDLRSIKQQSGEFNQKELAERVDIKDRIDIIIKQWRKLGGMSRRTLDFCVSKEQCEHHAEAYRKAGANVHVITEQVRGEERAYALDQLAWGPLPQIVCNVDVCLDEQTQILTQQGWATIEDITPEHEVANWNDGHVWFEKPKKIVKRDRLKKERMVFLETRSRSIRVTESHELLHRSQHQCTFSKTQAINLIGKSGLLPISGQSLPLSMTTPRPETLTRKQYNHRVASMAYSLRQRENISHEQSLIFAKREIERTTTQRYLAPHEVSLDQCRFIGFWLGDGACDKLIRKGMEYKLYQSNAYPNIVQWIDSLLDRLDIHSIKRSKNRETVKGSCVMNIWSLPRGTGGGCQQRKGVYEIEPYLVKEGTPLYWGFNQEQFDALLQGLWHADGLHGKKAVLPDANYSLRIDTVSHKFASLLQAIAVCRGYRANLNNWSNKENGIGYKPLYRLALRRETDHALSKHHLQLEEEWKEEKVWCVKTTSGNIITRRRGTVTVMGNCTEGTDVPQIDFIIGSAPTKSSARFLQRIGRGFRLFGETNNPFIEKYPTWPAVLSAKDHLLFLDIVDTVRSQSDIMTVPRILGLPANFDLDGDDLLEAKNMMDDVLGRNPALEAALETMAETDEKMPKTFRELKTQLERIMLFAPNNPRGRAKNYSNLAWLVADERAIMENDADNAHLYVLNIPPPREPHAGESIQQRFLYLRYEATENIWYISVQAPCPERTALEREAAYNINQTKRVDIPQHFKGQYYTKAKAANDAASLMPLVVLKEMPLYRDFGMSIRHIDSYVSKRHPSALPLLVLDAPWRTKQPSAGQLALAKRKQIPIHPDMRAGDVSDLINNFKNLKGVG